MRLRGVRGSRNVEDRRKVSGGGKAGIGGIGLLIILALGYFAGFDVTPLLQGQGSATQTNSTRTLSGEEQKAADHVVKLPSPLRSAPPPGRIRTAAQSADLAR